MQDLFRPDPVLLAFVFVTQFAAFPVLAVLGLGRVIGGRGAAVRVLALLVTFLALALTWTSFAPALNMHGLPVYAPLRRFQMLGGGEFVVLGTACALAVTAVLPGVRWRALDALLGLALLGYLGLWGYVTWA